MRIEANTVNEYLEKIPKDRAEVINKLRSVIKKNLPQGFSESIQYGMIAYTVPLNKYPDGYHAKANTPLPFISIASQKNTVNLYHTGIYGRKQLYEWFVNAYKKSTPKKLDMGKSCIRFKDLDYIPYDVIAELATKMTIDDVINMYEESQKKRG